jgi:hypothetical protein
VKTISLLPLFLAAFAFAHSGFGEEKNGLQVNVTKSTLTRDDSRGSYLYNADHLDRTQGLKVTITNVSFDPVPEGEVEWEILVHKYYSTAITSYRGTENLKALGKAQSVDMTIGAAPIEGYHYGTVTTMDKLDWQIVVKRGGVEVFRSASTPNFAALAKRASRARESK